MTGLRTWRRDAALPALAGDPGGTPPSEEEVLQRVSATLVLPESPRAAGCTWEYARWKPGVSITCAYRIRFEDGEERIVGLKRYQGDKAQSVLEKCENAGDPTGSFDRMLPRRLFVDEGLAIWCFPADRILRGLATFLDARLTARLLEEEGIVEPRTVRRRRTSFTLLRYKPERRAVYRLDLSLRSEAGQRDLRLAGRILEPAVAEGIAQTRRRLQDAGGCAALPRLLAADPRAGILLEEWLELVPFPPDSFDHARSAGRALARLHTTPSPPPDAGHHPPDAPGFLSLFAGLDALRGMAAGFQDPGPTSARTWIHGDFHPDQLGTRNGTDVPFLLDLDLTGGGDPVGDLASWIADHLVAAPEVGIRGASAPLLEGYEEGGGAAVGDERLAACVAAELVRRAASALRRLEEGAIETARRTLELARSIAPEGSVLP